MSKVLRVLFILVVLAALFVPLLIAMKYAAIAEIYSYFTDHLANLLGVNLYLIRAAVVLCMVPFFYALKLQFSVSSTKRKIASGIMAAFVVVYNIGVYQATKNLYFTFQEGKTLKWYAITPEGVRFYDRPGVDPVYGVPLKPVTPEVVRNLKTIEKGDFRTVDPAQVAWFNPITGDAQLWYYQSPDGELEFYNKPGYHPFTNEPLKAVTKEIYFRWRERAKVAAAKATAGASATAPSASKAGRGPSGSPQAPQHDRQRRLEEFRSLVNRVGLAPGRRNVAILIDAAAAPDGVSLDQAFYGQLKSDKAHFITDLFRRDLVKRGFFEDIFQGDKEMLRLATSLCPVDFIVLGKLKYSFRPGAQVDRDLVRCELNLSCKLVNQVGDVIKTDSFRALGPGFSQSAAIERGIELISDQFTERILKSIP